MSTQTLFQEPVPFSVPTDPKTGDPICASCGLPITKYPGVSTRDGFLFRGKWYHKLGELIPGDKEIFLNEQKAERERKEAAIQTQEKKQREEKVARIKTALEEARAGNLTLAALELPAAFVKQFIEELHANVVGASPNAPRPILDKSRYIVTNARAGKTDLT